MGRHLELVDRHDHRGRGRYDGMEYQGGRTRSGSDGSLGSVASVHSSASHASHRHANASGSGHGGSPTNGTGRGGGAPPRVGHDLIFAVEGGSASPTANDDDSYFEMEEELDFRLARRRKKKYVAGAALLVAFVAGIFVHSTLSRHAGAEVEGADVAEGNLRGKDGKNMMSGTNNAAAAGGTESVAEQIGEISSVAEEAEAALWPIADPPPAFAICPPPLRPDVTSQQHAALPVFHIGKFDTIPEAPSIAGTNDSPYENLSEEWAYELSAMDLSDDASIVAVGFSDYSGPPKEDGTIIDWDRLAVGMVRTFAFDCTQKKYRQVGQDLRGSNDGEMFGHRVSTSADGKTMAISAPSTSYDGGNGFVNVYYLAEPSPAAPSDAAAVPSWTKLGARIDNLDSNLGFYDRIGHAIALGETGQTLAILGVTDVNTYVVRVYKYNEFGKEWKMRGKSLTVKILYGDSYEFAPQLGLDDAGNTLSVSHPELGVVQYKYKWQTSKWLMEDNKAVNFTAYGAEVDPEGVDCDNDGTPDESWYIDGVATDRASDVVAFTAWEDGVGQNDFHAIKLVDFRTGMPRVAYNVTWTDYDVGVNVAVAKEGNVAAVVVSKTDVDDDEFWSDASVVGALTVLKREASGNDGGGEDDATWQVIGEGGGSDGMGVLGSFVSVSGLGHVVAIGSTDVVELYGVVLPGEDGGNAGDDTEAKEEDEDGPLAPLDSPDDAGAAPDAVNMVICPPFDDVDPDTAPETILDSLPDSPDEHTVALALSADASFLAIGLDFYDGEARGIARIYGWSCADGNYIQIGEDLFGKEEFDGFGQSIDISSDGKTVVVGANQPPPGKSGYVEVYALNEESGFEWALVGNRIDQLPDNAGDVGREVKIAHDGTMVTFLGSLLSVESGFAYGHSFVRTVAYENGEWKAMGDDLIGSVDYDEHGTEAHVTMSGDGGTLAIVGSYGGFLAKVYTFDAGKKNWTEVVIPTPAATLESEYDDDGGYEYVDAVSSYQYFSGGDVSLNGDGKILALAGTAYTGITEAAMVRLLRREEGGNWILSSDPIDFTQDYVLSSVDVDDVGGHVAIGVNGHTDDKTYQGALYVATSVADADGDNLLDWSDSTGIVDGVEKNDLLGARVAISSDGLIAAASSRKGYIAFFKYGQ